MLLMQWESWILSVQNFQKQNGIFSHNSEILQKHIITFSIFTGIKYTANIIRRSLKTNHSYSDLDEVGDGLKRYVKSIVAESVESYCLAPNKICLAGPPGLKGIQGNRGKRGPKGTKGKKGKGIMGTPGEPGKQGIKGEKGKPVYNWIVSIPICLGKNALLTK